MEKSSKAKPTLWTLWNFEAEALEEQAVAMTGLHPLVVAAAVAGCEVPREDFEKVLHAVNSITGTHYTMDELGGVKTYEREAG
jgi:hypothetical protein